MTGVYRIRYEVGRVGMSERRVEEPEEANKILMEWWEKARDGDRFLVICEVSG